jgi:hypothetical protein
MPRKWPRNLLIGPKNHDFSSIFAVALELKNGSGFQQLVADPDSWTEMDFCSLILAGFRRWLSALPSRVPTG